MEIAVGKSARDARGLRRVRSAVPRAWRRLPRPARLAVRLGLAVALAGTVVAAGPFAWARVQARGHLYEESDLVGGAGPRAEVVIVLGAQVAPGGAQPMPYLRGRLDTGAALLASGHGKVILVTGDAHGASGDETSVMTDYLASVGVDRARVVADPYGLDTYESCVRARQVYGIERAIVVTQGYHLARAVALCRQAGIDTDGVVARCEGCRLHTQAVNSVREYFACIKAAWEAWRDRPPAVSSPPSSAIADSLALL